MNLLDIEIENFLSIGKICYSYEEVGLCFVEGDNRDVESATSNGSGKSGTFVDALSWCLWGVTTRGLAADQVLPDTTGENCRVRVRLEDSGKQIEITRYRKHKEFASSVRVSVDGKDCSKSTNPATDKLIQELLKVSKKTFLFTTILGQGLTFRFSQLTDQERKEILETIVDLTVFEKARKLARKKVADLETKSAVSSSQFGDARMRILEQQESLRRLRENQESEQKRKDKKRYEIQLQIDSLAASLVSLSQQAQELESLQQALELADAAKKKVRHAEGLSLTAAASATSAKIRAEEQLRAMESLRSANCPTCNQVLQADHLVAEGKRRAQLLTTTQSDLAVAQAALSQKQEFARSCDATLADLQQKVTAARVAQAKIASTQEEITVHRRRLIDLDETDIYASQILAAQAALEKAIARRDEIASEITAITETLDLHKFWVDGFQDIRVHVIEQMLGFLNARLKHYCDVMTDGEVGVSLILTDKDKVDLQVTTRGRSYASTSGGEKDRIDIAIAFALHDLATQQTDFRSNILVLDEVAVFVDAAGIDRLMKLVSEKMDRVETCFVISQNPIFKGYADKVWTIVKEKGISRLEVA